MEASELTHLTAGLGLLGHLRHSTILSWRDAEIHIGLRSIVQVGRIQE